MLSKKHIQILNFLTLNSLTSTKEIREYIHLSNMATLRNLHQLLQQNLVQLQSQKRSFYWNMNDEGIKAHHDAVRQLILSHLLTIKNEQGMNVKNVPTTKKISDALELDEKMVKMVLTNLRKEGMINVITIKPIDDGENVNIWSLTKSLE